MYIIPLQIFIKEPTQQLKCYKVDCKSLHEARVNFFTIIRLWHPFYVIKIWKVTVDKRLLVFLWVVWVILVLNSTDYTVYMLFTY